MRNMLIATVQGIYFFVKPELVRINTPFGSALAPKYKTLRCYGLTKPT